MSEPQAEHAPEIRAARPEEIAAAAQVTAEAFQAEGFTNWLFDLSRPGIRRRLAREFLLAISRKHDAGDIFLVAVQGGSVIGAAVVSTPGQQPRAPRWQRILASMSRLGGLLGLTTSIRWRRILPTLKVMLPPKDLPQPHSTLVGLAVAPAHQGKGVARRLLDAVHDFVDSDRTLQGAYLFTGDARNREIYSRFAYELRSERRVSDTFTVYHMFRPRPTEVEAPPRTT